MADAPDANSPGSGGSNLGRAAPRPQPLGAKRESVAAPASLPAEIGGYQIQRVLGCGGMATVYAALQKQPRRIVALKVIKTGVASESTLRRFKREIEILGKLHHPNIAQVYGAGIHDDGSGVGGGGGVGGVPYFVMEYIAGAKNIFEYTAVKNLMIRDRLKLFVKVCAAIDHGHRNKIIHRDLKPGNILIDEFGEPKIIDFGVARAADLDIASQTLHADTGTLVGTLKYMAPEQVDSQLQDLDARCDVYALGALLYKLVTSQPPHDLSGKSVYEAVRIIREESPRPPGQINAEIRGDLETIILKAMERDRARRYTNAGSLGRDVVRYLSNKPIHARRASPAYRARLFAQRNRALLITAAAMVCVIGLAVAIVLVERFQGRGEQSRSSLNQPSEMNRATTAPQAPTPAAAPSQPQQPFAWTSPPANLEGHTGRISKLAFASDSNVLISTSYDHSVIMWDLSTRAMRFKLDRFKAAMTLMALAANAPIAAIAPSNGPITMVDIASGAVSRTFKPECGAIQALALSAGGDRIAVGCDDLTIRVIELKDEHERVLRGTTGGFTAIAFSREGGQLAAGSSSGDVYLWNEADSGPAARFSGLRGPINLVGYVSPPASAETSTRSAGFGEDSNSTSEPTADQAQPLARKVIAIAPDGSAAIWTLQAGDPPPPTMWNVLSATTGPAVRPLVDAALDPTGRLLGCADSVQVRVWDVSVDPPRELIQAPLKPRETPCAAAIDAAGRWCAVGQINGDITIFALTSTRP